MNYASQFVTKWRDGQSHDATRATHVVNYDQMNHAYALTEFDNLDDFLFWVAMNWEIDRDPQNENETPEKYLDRVGIIIKNN